MHSSAQWLAQVYDADYRAAARITRTSDALRELPALDEAMSNGDLTLDQVARRVEVATPETDVELARIAVGKQPGSDRARRAHARAADDPPRSWARYVRNQPLPRATIPAASLT